MKAYKNLIMKKLSAKTWKSIDETIKEIDQREVAETNPVLNDMLKDVRKVASNIDKGIKARNDDNNARAFERTKQLYSKRSRWNRR